MALHLQQTPSNKVVQRQPVEKLHGDEGLTVVFTDVVDGADVRVVERRCRLRLALETGERLRVLGYFLRQELQRDKSVQARVLGLVDHPHAAAARLLDDAVVQDGWPITAVALVV